MSQAGGRERWKERVMEMERERKHSLSSIGKIQAHDAVVGVKQCSVHLKVCRRACDRDHMIVT